MHRRWLGQHPCSPCSIQMYPLGTLRRCRCWLSNVGIPKFLISVQGMLKLLVHESHFDYQGCSYKSTIPVLVTINRAEYLPTGLQFTSSVKSSRSLEGPLGMSVGAYWEGFSRWEISVRRRAPWAPSPRLCASWNPPQGSGDLGTLNRGYKAIIVLCQNILIMTFAIL